METISRIKKQFQYIENITCSFIEKNKNNFENLKKEINNETENNPEKYEGIKIIPINDEFANVASVIIEKVGGRLAPSFFFIDPFGFSGVPFHIMKDILSIARTEVFLTFMVRDVNRFLKSSKHWISIEELYGIDNVQEVIDSTYSNLPREQALLKLYRDRLHKDAGVKYTFPFLVCADKRLQTTYYLIHATNHPLGCKLMKGIMYRTGTEGRFGYLGPAEGQVRLDSYDKSSFKDFLLNRFGGRTLSFKEVIYETLMETCFVEKDYRDILKDLEKEGCISIDKKGPRGGLSLKCKVTFYQKYD